MESGCSRDGVRGIAEHAHTSRRSLEGIKMENRDTVKVYCFRVFDPALCAMRLAAFKASRKTITSHLGGEVLEGTEQDVSTDELDEQGRYRRIATGWGALN